MKNLNYLLLLGAGAMSLNAAAQATWVKSGFPFLETQKNSSIFFDANNNDRLDLFYGGEASVERWRFPGIWDWQCQTNLYLNQGEGQWEEHAFSVVEGETGVDEDGNPVQYYRLEAPDHGIAPVINGHVFAFDYNNDGLVDLFVGGQLDNNDQLGYKDLLGAVDFAENISVYTALYKNLGNGKFERVENHGIPAFRPDSEDGLGVYPNSIAAGDYDHDGYTDLFITGLYAEAQPEGRTNRICCLFRNVDGTGKFERKDIANVIGGVWTSDIKDEEGNVIREKEELPGWFLPQSCNVHFVDLNNDGWLDIVTDGWADAVWDGVHTDGANLRVYLNNEGKSFEDITPMTPALRKFIRGASSNFADFDGDGYLDMFMAGYHDEEGFTSRLAYNQLSWDETVFEDYDDKSIFKQEDGSDANIDWFERHRSNVRDFDGDGYLDIFFDGCSDSYIFYGNQMGQFVRAEQLPSRGYSGNDAICAVGDVTGNGLADQFQTGYVWEGDWKWAGFLYENKTEATVEAPAMPTGVEATLSDDNVLTITWNDVEDGNYTAAYNIYVQMPDGQLFTVLPANPETGFVKVSYGKEAAIRPMVQTYSMKVSQAGNYKVGVQAVSLLNETASAFASAETKTDGVDAVSVGTHAALSVSVDGDFITVAGEGEAEVKVINLLGQVVATGRLNTPIAVEADGVLVVTAGERVAKIMK